MTKYQKFLLAALCISGIGQAQATTHDISLTGTLASGQFSSFDGGNTHYDQWLLQLDTFSSISVSQGDSINATITLDQSFTMPASAQLTSFAFFMTGTSFPAIDTGTSGTTAFFNLTVPGSTGTTSSTTTSSQLANSVVFFPPNNGAMTFNSLTSNFVIDTLGAPVTLNQASISYTLFSPSAVPEPETYAMLLAGLGLVGFAARFKKKTAI